MAMECGTALSKLVSVMQRSLAPSVPIPHVQTIAMGMDFAKTKFVIALPVSRALVVICLPALTTAINKDSVSVVCASVRMDSRVLHAVNQFALADMVNALWMDRVSAKTSGLVWTVRCERVPSVAMLIEDKVFAAMALAFAQPVGRETNAKTPHVPICARATESATVTLQRANVSADTLATTARSQLASRIVGCTDDAVEVIVCVIPRGPAHCVHCPHASLIAPSVVSVSTRLAIVTKVTLELGAKWRFVRMIAADTARAIPTPICASARPHG